MGSCEWCGEPVELGQGVSRTDEYGAIFLFHPTCALAWQYAQTIDDEIDDDYYDEYDYIDDLEDEDDVYEGE